MWYATIRLLFFQLSLVHEVTEAIKVPQRKQFFYEDLRIKNYHQQMHIGNCENNGLN